ncbi:MAG: FGGY family carbohydrate kinase [Nitrospirota bacterium]|nr:FGGY family carbohydrate kinase [Nitrospirota bacterium]
MQRACYIGIDQGSSSTKAIVVANDGAILFRGKQELSPALREDHRVEQDPDEILGSVRSALDEAIGQAKNAGMTVRGAGLSCQRSSCLAWHKASGKPLSPVLSWRDTRGEELVKGLALHRDYIWKATGLPLTPYYSASKMRWLIENLPDADSPSTVLGTLSSFLCQKLTNSTSPLIDHTNGARTQLMNISSLSWDSELAKIFGLAAANLPEIVPTAHNFGVIETDAGPIPLLACMGDQQAAMLGLGVLERDQGGINYGTGGFLMVNTGRTLIPAPGLMASVHYSTATDRRYLLEGSVNAVGDALEWLKHKFRMFDRFEEIDELCRKAASDVVAFIALNGVGAPYWEPDAKTVMNGMTAESTPADIVRAAIEGITFFMRDIDGVIKAAGVSAEQFTVSGGLASIGYLLQTQADMLGQDLAVSTEQDASALGAAYLAGMQQGAWKPEDIQKFTQGKRIVQAGRNPGIKKRYQKWTELHRMARELDRTL